MNASVDMIRCCHCAIWFHSDCMGMTKDEAVGVWPCQECRQMYSQIKKLLEFQETNSASLRALTKTNDFLQTSLDKVTADLKAKSSQCDKLQDEVVKLRVEVGTYKAQLDQNTWRDFRCKKALLAGDSLLRDVDEHKLNNTTVTSMSGARIKDLADHIDAVDAESRYKSVYLCVGTNDCGEKETEIGAAKTSYTTMVTKLKDRVAKPSDIIISSVPPRIDNKDYQKHVDALNTALMNVAEETGATFIDNNTTFVLPTGEANDGYLVTDGIHLSQKGTNRLVKNLKVPTKPQCTDITETKMVVTPSANNTGWKVQKKEQGRRKNNNTLNGRGCHNCGETNHNVSNCRHGSRLKCHTCSKLGHKARHCWSSQH